MKSFYPVVGKGQSHDNGTGKKLTSYRIVEREPERVMKYAIERYSQRLGQWFTCSKSSRQGTPAEYKTLAGARKGLWALTATAIQYYVY